MRCSTCHVDRGDDEFVSKLGTRKIRTCTRCRAHKRLKYTARKEQATADMTPEELLRGILSQFTEWYNKQPPEKQAVMHQAISAQ
jgi:hypothetical protein